MHTNGEENLMLVGGGTTAESRSFASSSLNLALEAWVTMEKRYLPHNSTAIPPRSHSDEMS